MVSQINSEHSSAAAILAFSDGSFLMQLRENLPHVSFPNFWGFFGGEIENGETPEEALRRELAEEIGFVPAKFRPVGILAWELTPLGGPRRARHFFAAPLELEDLRKIVLGEGAAYDRLKFETLISGDVQVVPTDMWALHALEGTNTHSLGRIRPLDSIFS